MSLIKPAVSMFEKFNAIENCEIVELNKVYDLILFLSNLPEELTCEHYRSKIFSLQQVRLNKNIFEQLSEELEENSKIKKLVKNVRTSPVSSDIWFEMKKNDSHFKLFNHEGSFDDSRNTPIADRINYLSLSIGSDFLMLSPQEQATIKYPKKYIFKFNGI